MRKNVYLLVGVFVFFWLETGFRKVFPGSHLVPQFILVFVAVFAVHHDLKGALQIGMFGGFLAELFSTLYFGTAISTMLVAAFFAYFLTRNATLKTLYVSKGWIVLLIVTAAIPFWVFFYNSAASSLNLIIHSGLRAFYSWGLLTQALGNLTVFFPIQALINRVFHE